MTEQGIQVFLAVAETGSLSAAAQELYISQPAVSRHIRALEEELGCPLLLRGKGCRRVELSEQGKAFVQIAEKWRQLWLEAGELAAGDWERRLRVTAIGSVSTYVLPRVLKNFLEEDSRRVLTFHSSHSDEAYDWVAQGKADLALISDPMAQPQVETVPAFRQPMLLVAGRENALPERARPSDLDPAKELRLPWNPEYDRWHAACFGPSAVPRAALDETALLEPLFALGGAWADSWAIVPAAVAEVLEREEKARICRLEEGPPDEIIYYLLRPGRKSALTEAFLACLDRELRSRPFLQSYLTGRELNIT